MLLNALTGRAATLIRLLGLGLISWSVIASSPAPATSGRGLVVLITLVIAVASWLVWALWSCGQSRITPDLYAVAACGGVLAMASSGSAGSAFTFVIATAAGARAGPVYGLITAAIGAASAATGGIIYDQSALAVLAYSLGFAAVALAGSNIRQSEIRLDRRSCCSPRPSARRRSSCGPPGSRSRRGSPATSMMCSRTHWRA